MNLDLVKTTGYYFLGLVGGGNLVVVFLVDVVAFVEFLVVAFVAFEFV
jgi:hypothetical protein